MIPEIIYPFVYIWVHLREDGKGKLEWVKSIRDRG